MSADENAQFALLTTRKEYIYREIQILYDLSKSIIKDKTKIGAFKSRYKRIESVREEFIDVINKINSLQYKMDPKQPMDYNAVDSFDTLYYAIHTAAEEMLTPLIAGDRDTGSVAGAGASASPAGEFRSPIAQVKLAKLELCRFDGQIDLWQTFHDTFLALVHNNQHLSQIEKFHYLLSCLSGTALSVVKGVPVTADNYPVVYKTLVNRFENKRLLATTYLDKICAFPAIKMCNLNELRNLTSLLYESVNALKAVNIENLGEFILFYLASRSLDFDTRKRFESINKERIPTFEKLLEFLQDYVKILEASESSVFPRLASHSRALAPRAQAVRTYDKRRPNDSNTFQHRNAIHALSVGSAGMYSGTGPYSDVMTPFDVTPYIDGPSSEYYNAGQYFETGSYLEPGQYFESAPPSNMGPSLETKPGWNPDSSSQEEQDAAGAYAAAVYPNTANRFPDCVCCGFSHHAIYKCPLFHAYKLADRYKVIKTKRLCVNCLRPNHSVEKCLSKSSCSKCMARHHSLLHDLENANSSNASLDSEQSAPSGNPAITMSSTSTSVPAQHNRSVVVLGTCEVRARGPDGEQIIRALIDSGAQDCFMTSACARRLGLPLRRCNLTVAGLGQNTVHKIKGVTSCVILPRDSDNPNFNINPIVMDTITNQMPTVELPPSVRESCRHLTLADDKFDRPHEIDLLLGAELFHNLYDGQRLVLGPGLPVALHSVFGWVLTGKLDTGCGLPPSVTSLLVSTLALEQVVKRFWEVEEPPISPIVNPEHKNCEQLYSSLVKRNPDGRYVVPLLLKESSDSLGDTYNSALTRLFRLEKRFSHDVQLRKNYVDFMREYSDLGHMQMVEDSTNVGRYLIPHHCVLRPQSTTTSLRVVFDCSAKSSNNVALNDLVYTGPKLQNDIVDIVTNFRIPRIVFTADIAKMYRNIDLRTEDRKYQHILWRDTPTDPVREYELNTVTYGVSSSPYLAIRTLHQLADDHGGQWPQAAVILKEDTFMDDITAGAPSVEQALKLKDDLVNLLNCGKFELRKWSSNSPEFLAELPVEHCQVLKSFCDESNQYTLKILGIQWDPVKDMFTYSASEPNPKYTKRAILSDIARLYDPLGWLTPVVLIAKMILQDLWRLQLNWDEIVPPEMQLQWQHFCSDLQHLHKVQIPRQIIAPEATRFELIGFCDGSTKGYGCCIYLRSSNSIKVSSNLLIAKSRVAPLKVLTVNRLELLAAGLLSRVLRHTVQLLQARLLITKTTALTDSSTVLAWLNTPPYKLKTFVSHRIVKIIDEVSAENWQHVSTHDNVADLCSRGLNCSQLTETPTWWSGPAWLKADPATWPVRKESSFIEAVPEMKSATQMTCTASSDLDASVISQLLDKYSSFSRVQRVLAWCLRWVNNVRKPRGERMKAGLTVEELNITLKKLIQHEQASTFEAEIASIKRNAPCPRPIQKLNPFIDEENILRVGGRLRHSQLPETTKYPVLLSKRSRLSLLLVDYLHKVYLHCGPLLLQSLVLRKFWILGIRNLIRSRLARCVTCFKVNPKSCQPLMGNLPPSRVRPSRCFEKVGIDFAGPLTAKESRRRNARTYKVYVVVIVDLAVKAVHLDVVSELSTAAFIASLDRFVSRRGLCRLIISDCGTNFVGARRYLTEMQQLMLDYHDEIASELTKREIIWQLNPPTGSHFGGIFESGVRSMKKHLKSVVGLQVLTYEELATVLAKTEAILNSRPISGILNSPAVEEAVNLLTPGHFLTGGPLVSLPEPPLHDTYLAPRERWQMLQKLTQRLWRVWQRDYLHCLQQRGRWFQGQDNLKIGDIVLIADQNLQTLEWRSGQVTALHPGEDGIVRVVTLRTSKGYLKRPVTKLCPLPIHE